jgi:hypothetical protein
VKRETALKRDFRVRRARRLRVKQEYLHPEYRLTIPRKSEVTPTGRFVLFRLRPPKGTGHRGFWARWDNASVMGKPGPAVKVELDHPVARERMAFKLSLHGYAGHWTVPEPSPGKFHQFHISIVDRGTPVFRGTLSLAAVYALDFSQVSSDHTLQLCLGDDPIAEVSIVALGPSILRAIRIEKRLMRQGRPKRLARRLALIATSGSVPPSAWTLLHPLAPDLFRTPRYTKAEKRAVLARLIRQHGIRRADAAAMFDRAFVDRLFRRARRVARSTAASSDAVNCVSSVAPRSTGSRSIDPRGPKSK